MVKHGEYGDTFRSHNVEDEVREPGYHGTPDPAI